MLSFRDQLELLASRKACVFTVIVLMAVHIFSAPLFAAENSLYTSSPGSVTSGNRVLIITSDIDSGKRLGKILQELYTAEVVVKSAKEYTSFIDEAAFDAFVYYGVEYSQLPSQNFIDDMERTSKPVMWLNYHGWTLNKEYLGSKGISILDQHDSSFNKVKMKNVFTLTYTDTTYTESSPEKVIYFLQSPSGEKIPGAVHTGNYTFVTYSPNLDIFTSEFYPFLMAIRATFGNTPFPAANKTHLSYLERISVGRKDDFRTGVHLPVYVASSQGSLVGYESDKWHENLVRIKQSGAEWVNLVRTYYQTDIHSADIHVDEHLTPSLVTLKNIIHDAHELGLFVQIHMAINLKNRGPDDWHGMISPDNQSQWWEAYQGLALDMAAFSRKNGVEALIIGTEFTALQSDEKKWRTLINAIKQQAQYPGMLGYGVNYNSLDLTWMDALDFLGISAYWPLSEDRAPDMQTLNRAWTRIHKKLRTWMARHPDVRIEFTEVGYSSQPYSSVFPFSWKPHKGQTQSLTEQLHSYRSLYQFLEREPKIKGVHIFASTEEDDDPDSLGYTPFGKPAEKVLQQIMHIR